MQKIFINCRWFFLTDLMITNCLFVSPVWCCSTQVPRWLTSAALPWCPACPRRAPSPWTTSPTSHPSWKRSCGSPSRPSVCPTGSAQIWAPTVPAPARTEPRSTEPGYLGSRERWELQRAVSCVFGRWLWSMLSKWVGFLKYWQFIFLSGSQVTPQEHERRKRRRERNKIAAAKCRNKKKEKTEGLQQVAFNFYQF